MIGASALWVSAAEPDNYYASCEGKTGQALLQALATLVGPHTTVSYDGLWDVYKTSDVRADGTLWDIYSTKQWPANFTKCGNYKLVGDCVNREHSFPKSWWGGGSKQQYSDAYHLYPTDGKVNGQRSNYPYGECSNGTQLAANGDVKPLGKLGTSTFEGYSGKVFEPDDEYKGDLARGYFYMATAYNSSIASWSSDMLAGNNYPVFSTWAVNLLLKWSRQDAVSTKEINRNEAISKYQKNRNPYIDHPELVEYIWGNKVGIPWTTSAATDPQINTPVDGTQINLGTAAVNVARSASVEVKGTALTGNVAVSVSGNGFSVSPTTLAASAVNGDGATLTITYLSSTVGSATGTLTLRSSTDDVTTTCSLTASAVDGLPVGEAINVAEDSFVATWSCIDTPTTPYTVNVMLNGESLEEFPQTINAGEEQCLVEDLDPSTTYTYTISSPTLTSRTVSVTTLAPQPAIEFLYDGELEFSAVPGEPSEVAEVLMIVDNITDDLNIAVNSPFQLSTDKVEWSTNLTLNPQEERFYIRLFSQTEGSYSSSVTVNAGSYSTDQLEVEGTVATSSIDFYEDFEPKGDATYNDKTYVGSACTWYTNAYFESNGSNAYPNTGEQAARTPKSGGYLTMAESKTTGVGEISLWAHLWRDETTTSSWDVMVSDDAGSSWETVGSFSVTSGTYTEYIIPVNRKGSLRVKFSQTEGGRTMIDDIRISNYTAVGGVEAANAADYHTWDAFCRNGRLIIEDNGTTLNQAAVYAADGTQRFAGTLTPGETALTVAPGLYVVVVRDFARRVLVK